MFSFKRVEYDSRSIEYFLHTFFPSYFHFILSQFPIFFLPGLFDYQISVYSILRNSLRFKFA